VCVPPVSTVGKAAICIYEFRVIRNINRDYFLKRH
jgi:hypothetical protein